MDNGLIFVTDRSFECCVSAYDAVTLDDALHTDGLREDGYTHIRVDYKDSGIGSNSCGPALNPAYQLKESTVHFEVYLRG